MCQVTTTCSNDNFSKEGSFSKNQRTAGVTSVTPKLVFFVVAWTAVQQQRFANLVQFHDKLDIFSSSGNP